MSSSNIVSAVIRNTPTYGAPITGATFLDNPHLVTEFLEYCDVLDIVRFASSTKVNASITCDYLKQRLRRIVRPFFAKTTDDFLDNMSTCNAVISGSAALHFLLAPKSTPWHATDLDLYVPQSNASQFVTLLTQLGYQVIHRTKADHSFYSHSNILTVLSLSNGDRRIDLIVSKKRAAAAPIFQFHSTAVMNFVTRDKLFCAYPELTFRGLSLVNGGPLYICRRGRNTFNAITKYQECGFRYITCASAHELHTTCKCLPRSLTDKRGMWVNTRTLPRVSVCPNETFWHFGCHNICWVLGGMACGIQDGFVNGQVSVIEDASKMLNTPKFIGSKTIAN